jgi:hypothetical protein
LPAIFRQFTPIGVSIKRRLREEEIEAARPLKIRSGEAGGVIVENRSGAYV